MSTAENRHPERAEKLPLLVHLNQPFTIPHTLSEYIESDLSRAVRVDRIAFQIAELGPLVNGDIRVFKDFDLVDRRGGTRLDTPFGTIASPLLFEGNTIKPDFKSFPVSHTMIISGLT